MGRLIYDLRELALGAGGSVPEIKFDGLARF